MQIADLRLAVRPRLPYEAMDLGPRLVQAEAGPLCRVWFAVTLPVLAVAAVLAWQRHGLLAWLLLWWLKPVYDHALLAVLSHRVFGETPTLRATLRLLAASWRQGLPGALLWRRLSMSRAYLLPVRLLEQLPRRERNARISLLRNRYTGRARWLHIVMMHFEMLLMAAMISMVFWFAPATQAEWLWLQLSQTDSVPTGLIVLLGWYAAMTLVEPCYVAAGFTLYLNRRTELEAWDLELAFRHMRARLDARRKAA